MANNTVIKVEGLSKQYLLNKNKSAKSDTLFGNFVSSVKNLKNIASKKEMIDFWALNNVSFEIAAGDRVGIIGRNGAGKSTLLKVLSRITPPTKGRVEITGRVASLLEVGTGFHGDLSGRENIYLNGSILGMSKHEIDRKFDEIVAFAEIEKFLDTPVKRYSSGMYVRLAFAVAAHLEPEILIVDEVLAVGDAAFQKKCIGKMKDVSRNEGRTILFVSHSMAAVQNICDKCLYLKNGELMEYGATELVIPKYLLSSQASSTVELSDRNDRMGNGAVRFQSIVFKDEVGNVINNAQCGSALNMELTLLANPKFDLSYLQISIGVDDENGIRITHLSNSSTNQIIESFKEGTFKVNVNLPNVPLKQGGYTLTLFSSVNSEVADWIQEATVLQVEAGDFFKTGKLPEDSQGNFYINHSFNLVK